MIIVILTIYDNLIRWINNFKILIWIAIINLKFLVLEMKIKLEFLKKTGNILECPCKIILFTGLICRHIFSILQFAKDLEPSKYIQYGKKITFKMNEIDPKSSTNNDDIIKSNYKSNSDNFNDFSENQELN